ncbi:hypothetical protein [uncultured Rhodospira sp.]|uniref:hypothetical protein n=1 Tax=uncultured Rhodospira sp. TaxID=1936189 RepID=UPI00262A12F6|nr:hypothetical protein [uncultured Rhodospira sp.]
MTRRFPFSPRGLLLAGFGGLALAFAAALIAVTLPAGGAHPQEPRLARAAVLANGLDGWVRARLEALQAVAETTQATVAAGLLTLDDAREVDAYVRGLMAGAPALESLALITPDGRARRYGRDGAPVREDWGERPAVSAMVTDMLARPAAGDPTVEWGHPVWRSRAGHAVFNIRATLVRDGAPVGVLLAMVGLDPIAPAVSRHADEDGADAAPTPYVLYGGERVLAHPRLDGGGTGDGVANKVAVAALPALSDLNDPALAALSEAGPAPNGEPVRHVRLPEAGVVHVLRRVDGVAPEPLLVGAHVAVSSAGVFSRTALAIGAAVGLGLSVVVLVGLAWRRAAPPA